MKKVRCQVTLPTFSRVLVELVLNAIDANASFIKCFVDLNSFSLAVSDDGDGISLAALESILEHDNVTSKKYAGSFHGFRGETLYSLAMHSKYVEVESKQKGVVPGYRKVKLTEDREAGTKYSVKEVNPNSSSKSYTSIIAKGVYYMWPVRQKSLIINEEVLNIQKHIFNVLLPYPFLEFQCDILPKGRVEIKKSSSVLLHWTQMHPELKDHNLLFRQSWEAIPLQQSDRNLMAGMRFHFALTFSRTSWTSLEQYQLVFVNNRHVQMENIKDHIRQQLLRVVATNTERSFVHRGHRRHPIFFLNIFCKDTEYDILFDPQKSKCSFLDEEAALKALDTFLRALDIGAFSSCRAFKEGNYGDVLERCIKEKNPRTEHQVRYHNVDPKINPCRRRLWRRQISVQPSDIAVSQNPIAAIGTLHKNFLKIQFSSSIFPGIDMPICSYQAFMGDVQDYKITTKTLRNMAVIGQFDKKFILATSPDCKVLCVDQHAASERIWLEKLENDLFGLDKKPSLGRHTFKSPKTLKISGMLLHTATIYKKTLYAWNFHFTIWEKTSSIILSCIPIIASVPVLLSDFVLFLHALRRSFSTASHVPPFVTRILNYRACRSAVAFGDDLSMIDCQRILRQLASCKLPFQCAHGRPTVAPLMVHTKSKLKNEAKLRGKIKKAKLRG